MRVEELGAKVRVYPFAGYYFDIEKEKLAFAEIKDGVLAAKKASRLRFVLEEGFKHLVSSVTGRPTVFIDQASGIPLIGSNYFGIIDRNTSLIELRPLTGCNLNCIFCSVDEGIDSVKTRDFLVERAYLMSWFRMVAEYKAVPVEAQINAQGEPSLYPEIVELVNDLSHEPNVSVVSLITNGTLLSEKLIDDLAAAGLGRLNLSMNAFSEETAVKLAGTERYSLSRIKQMASYAAGKLDLIINPVWLKGLNDKDMVQIALFTREIGAANPPVGIQNFLPYSKGRNPVKQATWEEFDEMLAKAEKASGVSLHLKEEDFKIVKTKPLPKPFKKGDAITASVACPGRFPGELIAVFKDRCIHAIGCSETAKSIRLKITRSKHNIFFGKPV